jgi:gas vesicle protein
MKRFGWFIAGGALGAIGALLLAPRSGQETREYVVQRAGGFVGDAQGAGAQAVTTIQGSIKQATEAGAQVVSNITGTPAAQDAQAEVADKNDELRAKIEAARERIAAQVKANAAQSAQSVAEATEAPAAEEPASAE